MKSIIRLWASHSVKIRQQIVKARNWIFGSRITTSILSTCDAFNFSLDVINGHSLLGKQRNILRETRFLQGNHRCDAFTNMIGIAACSPFTFSQKLNGHHCELYLLPFPLSINSKTLIHMIETKCLANKFLPGGG